MADSVEVSTIETTDGTIGVIRDNAARQSIANLREGKETVGSVAWENVKGRPTKVSELENDKKYQTDENVSNTLNSTLYAGSSTHGGPATSADKLTTARTISLTGAASGSGSFDGSANSSINVQSLDATKLTGTVPITNLPPSVIERMSVVKDDTERFALTTDSVQDGDVVKVQSTNLMYYVVDDTKLSTEAGYEVFKAGSAASVPWGGVTGKPSTFPPSSHTHTKSQITDFPSSMPNPNNLTMQIEGSDAAVYNGGTAQAFNVTKSALGLDKVNNTADADKSVKYASSAPWIGVTGKPSTFPPSAHTHSMSQITDLGVFGGASATAAGSAGLVPQPAAGDQDKYLSAKGTWESITGKISGTKVASANSADKLTTARTLTVGNTGKSFDGSANVSWSLSEIGALPVNGNAGTVNGHTVNSDVPAGAVFTDHTYSAGDGLVLNGTEFKSRLNNRITIDLSDSKYDQNKWYPVVGTALPATGLVWLRVACQLNTEAAVTWSSHSSGTFTANLEILTKASGWGTTNSSTIVLDYSWGWTKDSVCPVSYRQMNNSSAPVFYLRGGGRYYVYASYDVKFTVYTSAYTASGETVDVQSSCPSIDFNYSTVYANLAGTADAANNVAWEHTNHPATFPPSSHTHTKSQITDFPSSLKNPNALSITANGTTVTYDGSSAQSITLSSGSSKSIASTLLASGWSGSAAPYTYDLGPTYGANAIIGFDSAVGNTTQLEAARAADIQGSSTTKIYAYGEKPTVDIPIVINYIQHSEIPTYVKDSVLNIVNRVKAIQDNANTFTFIAASDAHQWNNENVTNGNLHAGMAMKALAYALNLDCAMYLGDYTTGSATTTIEEGLEHIGIINQDIDEAFKGLPQLRTTGNHDPLTYSYSQNNDYLSEEELFPLIGAYCQGATYGSNTAGYCYRDFASNKIRVICLNTADITAATSGSAEAVSVAQRIWFAETLLSAGNLGSDWGIIIVSHHPLDWGGILIMSNIVQAYVTGSSVTVTSGHSYNFNGHNSAHFICQFHGHVHCYKMDKLHYTTSGTEYDAYRMAIPNMCFNRNNEYGTTPSYYGIVFGETTTYNKTANSAEDTAFCVVCIDLDAEKIYAFHYGAGYDRTLKYGAATIYSVTNMLTHVSTSNQNASVSKGDSYTATISATAPYSVGTITVTMGGVDITASAVSGSTITIAEVTGDITVTASGVLGNLINYFGYTDNNRISMSDGGYRTKSGSTTIDYIKLSEFANNNTVSFRITGAQFIHKTSPWDDNAFVFYNASKNFTVANYLTGTVTYGNITITCTATSDTDMTITITGLKAVYLTSSYSYLRLCGVGSGANIDIRLVEP